MKLQAYSLFAFIVVILLFSSPTAWAWRAFKIIFTGFPYEAKSDLVDVKIKIENTTGDTVLNVVANFNQDVDDLHLTYAISFEVNDGNYTSLVNKTLNFCKFLKQRNAEPILRTIYEDLLKQGSFVKSCPIKKGTYTLHDYRMDEEMLPSYVPETTFAVYMKLILSSGVNLFEGQLNGKIDKSKGFNNLKMFSLG